MKQPMTDEEANSIARTIEWLKTGNPFVAQLVEDLAIKDLKTRGIDMTEAE